ncbi:hypothetical protein CKO25_17915 [Thiocapsa imhoffii]|uniref:Uncharacterized protein n=1 Tax=Thiocapsa imhoffii TaxID=382777 RepID=A0A9X1BA13_9GAMM|nr:hypothetical protein [Thiocapsa imhoffii]MBK1646487.1 hypothetical protein [Thiocapsa imhoffii]
MKPNPQLARILAWALDGQSEPAAAVDSSISLSDERINGSLRGEGGFSKDERALLLRSPEARGRLRFLIEASRAEQLLRWKALAVDQSLSLRAAAGGAAEPVHLENKDFLLTLLPLDPRGQTWALHLKLAERLATTLRRSRLKVRDESGLVWLAGTPDDDGELSSAWTSEESPLKRLERQRLILEPD